MNTIARSDNDGFTSKPYVRVYRTVEAWRCDGVASCVLGHKIFSLNSDEEEGIFAEWSWNGSTLVVRNDRYGFYPLFYVQTPDGISVSSSLIKLLELGAPTALNAKGMAVFLRLGWFIGDDTPFEAIRAFPPGATLEWKDGSCQITSRELVHTKVQNIDYDDALDRYSTLFRAAIVRHAPPTARFVVPLSGGRDSRHILLALLEAGFIPAACVTQKRFPTGTSAFDEDCSIASVLCKELGINHVIVQQESSRMSACVRKNMLTEFCAMEHAWSLPFSDYINAHADYAYDGIGGDVLSGGRSLSEEKLALYDAGRYETLANDMLGDNDGYLPRLLQSDQYKRFSRSLAVQTLVTEIQRHAKAPNPVDSFYFSNRTRRTIALGTFTIWGRKATVLMPYLDYALYDFVSSLPARMLMDIKFHSRVIHRDYPRYAHIPFDEKRPSPMLDLGYLQRFAVQSIGLVSRKPRGLLLRRAGFVPRAIRCLVDTAYCNQILSLAPLAIYLLQLEEFG